MSTGGVLGRANNWRSLDSRGETTANIMPTLNANFLIFDALTLLPHYNIRSDLIHPFAGCKKSPTELSVGRKKIRNVEPEHDTSIF